MSTYCYVDTYFPHFYKLTDVNTATTGRLRRIGVGVDHTQPMTFSVFPDRLRLVL
ncbi:MAG: hypothetical protein WBF04_08360 [Candidatus Sulfotelmatobacter sp.]